MGLENGEETFQEMQESHFEIIYDKTKKGVDFKNNRLSLCAKADFSFLCILTRLSQQEKEGFDDKRDNYKQIIRGIKNFK